MKIFCHSHTIYYLHTHANTLTYTHRYTQADIHAHNLVLCVPRPLSRSTLIFIIPGPINKITVNLELDPLTFSLSFGNNYVGSCGILSTPFL